MTSPASIIVQRRIEWADTDAAGYYHNATVWRLTEAAEAVLHDRLGIREHTFGRTPRVRSAAGFRAALYFYDLVDVELAVAAVGRTSITYHFAVRRGADLAAEGESVSVLIDRPGGSAVPWPDAWREALTGAGPQRPERIC
jgi:acyl-CoA thioester hydrolase